MRNRYHLRYTNDLHVLKSSDDLDALTAIHSDYKIHVVDTHGADDIVLWEIVWQNSLSDRFGDAGVAALAVREDGYHRICRICGKEGHAWPRCGND